MNSVRSFLFRKLFPQEAASLEEIKKDRNAFAAEAGVLEAMLVDEQRFSHKQLFHAARLQKVVDCLVNNKQVNWEALDYKGFSLGVYPSYKEAAAQPGCEEVIPRG